MHARIIKLISNDYTVYAEDKKEYICKSRGKFRNDKIRPLVGDFVEFDPINHYILSIEKRKNELIRPPVSNIDQVIVVTSTKLPDFSSNLLDKLLYIISFHNIKPIICFTKLDLLTEEEKRDIDCIVHYYKSIGYEVCLNTEIDKIKALLKGKVTVFTGQSGAGKSTLLNKLDSTLELLTDEISIALGRGKHTTRHVELHPLFEGWVADTPGFSSVDFEGMTSSDIRDQVLEFEKHKDECKYKDCMHVKEESCRIKELVEDHTILPSRYQNYLKFIGR